MGLLDAIKKKISNKIDWNEDLLTIIREHTSFRVLETDKQMIQFWTILYAEKYGEESFFPIVRNCGGIVIDDWIRLYGAGELSITDKNHEMGVVYSREHPEEVELILGEDVLGGLYGFKAGQICFYDPGTVKWRSLGKTYDEFMKWLITSPEEVNQLYDKYRWNTWKEDVKTLALDEGFTIMPRLFLDSETPINERYRAKSGMREVIGMLYLKM